ncbi:hypothetical protein DGG96_09430 [Legionella qingyii]|uniref:Uncharacterized protein n=1 Tax=Legionella qingyii TaxID=2184757 RepID=A0A317U549_9GAMM|nr:hypothetical protein DGG96_09430 [Legionella qingyii]
MKVLASFNDAVLNYSGIVLAEEQEASCGGLSKDLKLTPLVVIEEDFSLQTRVSEDLINRLLAS